MVRQSCVSLLIPSSSNPSFHKIIIHSSCTSTVPANQPSHFQKEQLNHNTRSRARDSPILVLYSRVGSL